ncbi:hypothetical protein HZA97_04480 [Candidatus Woesearchaeota archaeon]|nr:hypothetical protein [Candidatus Woesearchaeota archaeon]
MSKDNFERTLKLIEMLKIVDELEEKAINRLRELVEEVPFEEIKNIEDEEQKLRIIKAYAEIAAYDAQKYGGKNGK